MASSPTRRLKRLKDKEAKKLFQRIQRETMAEIMKQPQEEREKLLLLYETINEQRKHNLENLEQNTPTVNKGITEEEQDWFNNIDVIKPIENG